MRIEFFPAGSHDCPAILFYDCPSAGAAAIIESFRLLAEDRETEISLHEVPGVSPVGEIEVFATNTKGRSGVQQLSNTAFRWRRDREGWLEATDLAEPVARNDRSEGIRFQYLEHESKINVIFSTDRAW